jgi:PAS domain-containing protein
VRGKDGKIIYIEVLSVPYYSEKGVVGFHGIARAITARKQAEDALSARERQMRALVTSLDDIVFEVDEQGTYRQVWTSNENLLPTQVSIGEQESGGHLGRGKGRLAAQYRAEGTGEW